jgi:pimeloyl-ACP methyl ester carboxylesterase
VVALHGFGGEGLSFSKALIERTDRQDWVLVAPTFVYGHSHDPAEVTEEETSRFIPGLHRFLDDLPGRIGLEIKPHAVFYGFSRGAQLAQRFALVYPEQTRAVVLFSAGTYTLPASETIVAGHIVPLPYPFGTADLIELFGHDLNRAALRRIPVWVGVGEDDKDPADLPRQWDRFLGDSRVARAHAFTQWLADIGVPVHLAFFRGWDTW